MTTTVNLKMKSIPEIIIEECQVRIYKKINIDLFSNGVYYRANKVYMYYRVPTKEYIIVLYTDSGYLVNTLLDLRRALNEVEFLSRGDIAEKMGTPITINSFFFINDKNIAKETEINTPWTPLPLQVN